MPGSIAGKKFNRLFVKSQDGEFVTCLCDCGNEIIRRWSAVKYSQSKSCGCLKSESTIKRNTTHGEYNGYTHQSWRGMIERCTNPNHRNYKDYGGRGITVCDRWKTYLNFKEDMGERPLNMSIGRIDNDKGYCKENCEWQDKITQANNTRSNVKVTAFGETMSAREWQLRTGVNSERILKRIRMGWTGERAVSTPVRKLNRKKKHNG